MTGSSSFPVGGNSIPNQAISIMVPRERDIFGGSLECLFSGHCSSDGKGYLGLSNVHMSLNVGK